MSRIRRSEAGISLSRGPALVLGSVLLVAGLFFLYRVHVFPRFAQFPNAHAHTYGKAFFGIFGLNGWSGELTAAAGGLLLFGAAQHLLAKTASLVVAIALGGVGVWALVNHNSALGLFATNIWTIVLWLAAAALLLINAGMPRRRRAVAAEDAAVAPVAPVAPATRGAAVPAAGAAGAGAGTREVRRPITGTDAPVAGTAAPVAGTAGTSAPATGTAAPVTGTDAPAAGAAETPVGTRESTTRRSALAEDPATGAGEPVTSTRGLPVRDRTLED